MTTVYRRDWVNWVQHSTHSPKPNLFAFITSPQFATPPPHLFHHNQSWHDPRGLAGTNDECVKSRYFSP